MHTGLVQVNEMFVDLAKLVKEQQVIGIIIPTYIEKN